MRDLTDELLAIQQASDAKSEWSTRELLGVIRPGRIMWDRVTITLLKAIDQAKLQKIPNVETHFISVSIHITGQAPKADCKLSGYGCYLFLNELKPTDLVRSALAYFCSYAAPSAPSPVDDLAPVVELPRISLRTQLTSAVRGYAAKFALDFDFAWNQVYTQHRNRFKIDIRQRAKNAGVKTLDWAEQNAKIPELLAIANYLAEPKPYSVFPPDQEVS